MRGVIKAINKKGFFFVVGEDKQDRFAHVSNLVAPATFPGDAPRPTDIREGVTVEFEPLEIPGKGLRAAKVTVVA